MYNIFFSLSILVFRQARGQLGDAWSELCYKYEYENAHVSGTYKVTIKEAKNVVASKDEDAYVSVSFPPNLTKRTGRSSAKRVEWLNTWHLGGTFPMSLEWPSDTMSFKWHSDTASFLVNSYYIPPKCPGTDTFVLSIKVERPWYWPDYEIDTARIRFSDLKELLDLRVVDDVKKFDKLCTGDPFSRCTFTGKILTLWMRLSKARVKFEISRV